MATRAVVAGEKLRRHCPGRELASTARLPAPVSRGVRAAGAGRPEVPARPGPASCPRAGRAAPGRDYSEAFRDNRPRRPSRHQQPSRGPLTRAPACLLPGSGVLRPDPDCASSSAFSGVMLGACSSHEISQSKNLMPPPRTASPARAASAALWRESHVSPVAALAARRARSRTNAVRRVSSPEDGAERWLIRVP